LIAVPGDRLARLVQALRAGGALASEVVGEITGEGAGEITVVM